MGKNDTSGTKEEQQGRTKNVSSYPSKSWQWAFSATERAEEEECVKKNEVHASECWSGACVKRNGRRNSMFLNEVR